MIFTALALLVLALLLHRREPEPNRIHCPWCPRSYGCARVYAWHVGSMHPETWEAG